MAGDAVINATGIQRAAADPATSVILRASAGAGKTKVLVDRFVRLCVEEGPARAEPRSILAVTFTRKAAVEIQERLLGRAVKLALADPGDLTGQLTDLLGRAPSTSEMAAAAGLHEKLLEDLSALNVGTIHSFCQLVLSRFAAEAGLDPHFSVLENPEDLMEEALDRLEVEIGTHGDLAAAARLVGRDPAAVRKAVKDVVKSQMALDRWLRSVTPAAPDGTGLAETPRQDGLEAMLASLRAFLFPDLDSGREPRPTELLTRLRDALGVFLNEGLNAVNDGLGALRNDKLDAAVDKMLRAKLAPLQVEITEALVTFATDSPPPGSPLWKEQRGWTTEYVDKVQAVFLTQKGALRIFSKVKKDDTGPVFNRLVAQQAKPVLELVRTFNYLRLYDENAALLRLALRLMDLADELKRRDRVIDFHDLEEYACRLMGDEARALSLLYRLDDSINHILLDEFQDTNFNQWDMLRPFVEEFLGGGDPDRRKTVFVVGDVKQSIYGFRGAEPGLFAHTQALLERFEQRVATLPTNFRSLEAVVHGVGCLFNEPQLAGHLSRDERMAVRQSWARLEAPGEVYFLEPYAQDPDDGDERSGDQRAADAAARLARHLVDAETETWEGYGDSLVTRPLCWGDILVLCRSRTEISLYEKAFRNFGVPIMPPGRGMLAASREVQDILALLRWLVYPDDDVALCTVLRSPLFRLSEAEFQEALAARKILRLKADGDGFLPPKDLWASIRERDDDTPLGRAAAQLTRWRRYLDLDTCHNLLRRIFREGQVRDRFAAALGDQARHNLLRLFDLALGPEVSGTPTVRRLIDVIDRAARLGGEEEAVQPQTGTRGRVRFMTIHGAKGLEAPVVILVDADRPIGRETTQVRVNPGNPNTPLLFRVKKDLREGFDIDPDAGWRRDMLQNAADRGRLRTAMEDANLLYVALTRARDRLYVLGGDKRRGPNHDSALRQVLAATAGSQCTSVTLEDPPWLDRPAPPFGAGTEDTAPWLCDDDPEGPIKLPGGLQRARVQIWTPPVLTSRVKTETPSAAEGDAPAPPAVPGAGGDRQAAIDRGHRVHLLLQLAADTGAMPPGDSADHAEAAAVFGNPDFAWLFDPAGGRAVSEAPVLYRKTADGATETRVTGIIDRLVIRTDRVDIIDYKTNRTGGDPTVRAGLVDHYRPQLAAYREVMASLYPDREIRTWLLFTETAPGDLVEATP